MQLTISKGGTSFSPITGYSSTNAGFVNTISLEAAAAGVSKLRTTFFIGALEENLDVKAEVMDASGDILNKIQVPAAPFKRNRATFLTGSLYSTSGTGSFQVETTFDTDYHMDF